MLKSSIIFFLLTPTSLAATLSYDWNIGFITAAPDGVYRRVIGINGQWPLPTIEGTVGDIVTINVTNNLGTQSTGLHFHGINQKGSPIMDGPSGVSQCPIPPGASFTYTFEVRLPEAVEDKANFSIAERTWDILVPLSQQWPVSRWFERTTHSSRPTRPIRRPIRRRNYPHHI
jgi:hypothetical protein